MQPHDHPDHQDHQRRDHHDQQPGDQQPNEEDATLFVGHLADDVTDQDLCDLFAPFGAVDVFQIRDRQTRQPKGFGFARFSTAAEAANALELDGVELSGQPIRVRAALKRSEDR